MYKEFFLALIFSFFQIGNPAVPIQSRQPKENARTGEVKNSTHPEKKHYSVEKIKYEGNSYDVITISYPAQKISMALIDSSNNQKIRSLEKLIELKGGKDNILFATNGGMYSPDLSPVGLYIENYKEVKSINLRKKGYGNFLIQPNGVFLLTETEAVVVKSDHFSKYKKSAKYATQSGPMLVFDGKQNPVFKKQSTHVNIRNGVGIDAQGNVVFVISNNEVTLYDFAAFFFKHLNCANALYLDGSISRMYLPDLQRYEKGGNFGVLIYAAKN